MDFGLIGKCVMIFGGSWGIGWFMVELFKKEGCLIVLCVRGVEGVNIVVVKFKDFGDGFVYVELVDLVDGSVICIFVKNGIELFGGFDFFIYNVSGFGVGGSEEDWCCSFDIDMMVGVCVVEEVLFLLKVSDVVSIIFIGLMVSKYYFGWLFGFYGVVKVVMWVYVNEFV